MAVWFLLGGLLLILFEVFNPGFFIAVPGGTLVLMGTVGLLFDGIMFSEFGWILWPVAGVLATFANFAFYKKWAPPGKQPDTLVQDSLPGREGQVTAVVVADNLDGKVLIEGTSWSARVERGHAAIPVGARVRVLRAEGVHVVVAPV